MTHSVTYSCSDTNIVKLSEILSDILGGKQGDTQTVSVGHMHYIVI